MAVTKKEYTDDIIMVLAKLKALLNLPLRGVCAMLEDYVKTHKIVVTIPHYSTVSRRVKTLNWVLPRPVGGEWTRDSTGFGVSGPGEYFNARFNFDPKAKYKKLHVMSDLADGRIIAATFTGASGKGSGDVSVVNC